jgi:hypothetical protein
MIIAENVQKGWFFLNFRSPSPGHDVIVPFFPDYQENDSKEPIDYDQWHDGG